MEVVSKLFLKALTYFNGTKKETCISILQNDITSATVKKNKNTEAVPFSMPLTTMAIFATHFLLVRGYIVNEE